MHWRIVPVEDPLILNERSVSLKENRFLKEGVTALTHGTGCVAAWTGKRGQVLEQ